MSQHTLRATERRLVSLFVGGAFIFLVIFEAIFLIGRIVLENQFQRDTFEKGASRVVARMMNPEEYRGREPGRPMPLDIGFVMVNQSGKVIENRIGGALDGEEVGEFLNMSIIESLPFGKTTSYSGVYIHKIIHPKNPDLQILVIKNGGYNFDDILRDILRFLALDLLILLPFWYLGRYFVREILKPVGENMEVMSHFIYDAGHELKTPLAIVSGNLQVLKVSQKKDHELIDSSISTISSMADSLDGLVELSNLKAPDTIPYINILPIVDEVLKLHETSLNEKQISCNLSISERAKAHIEAKHFSILLTNLIKNAINYNKKHGTISIEYKEKQLIIQDTGIGIDEKNLSKIFDRFFRVDRSGSYDGTGIGLSLVDRIIKIYDWKIEVKSTPGVGTTFIIRTK